jgi:NADP-dependent 3-hydroxy acid dehydrogenase YdfG
MLEFDLTGRAGVVTGAGKGIGEAVAVELAGLGAKVVACARTRSDLDRVTAQIREAGGEAIGFRADVRRFEEMTALAKLCADTYGSLDFAVTNAGMDVEDNMLEGNPADWQAMIETNVLGMAYTIRAALPYMKEKGGGNVVIMASISGRITYVGEPMYIASKWAVAGMGGALRREALEYGVRVTLIEPGLVDTPMIHSLPEANADLGRIEALQPIDCARAVAFALCQPRRVNMTQIGLLPLEQSYSS